MPAHVTAALVCLALACAGAVHARTRPGAAAFLGLALAFLAIPAAGGRATPGSVAAAVPLALATAVLVGFLLLNALFRRSFVTRGSPRRLHSLLAGLGLAALAVLDAVLPGRVTGTLALLAGYLSFLFCALLLASVHYRRVPARRDADFVVVLGAGLRCGRVVTPLLARRLDRARGVLDDQDTRGNHPTLVTSGGQGPDELVPEAQAMAEYATAHGLDPSRILHEDRSRTTAENLRFSRTLMSARVPAYRCAIVTSDFHALRTSVLARREGVEGEVVGAPTPADRIAIVMVREFAGVLVTHPVLVTLTCAALVTLSSLAI